MNAIIIDKFTHRVVVKILSVYYAKHSRIAIYSGKFVVIE
jgi:hypothetical protein